MNRHHDPKPSARLAGDGGFTLIEVMVVVLVLGILLAIGIPTYLGARERAQDSAAQSSLRTAQVTASVVYTDNGTYTDANTRNLQTAEPGYVWRGANSASRDQDEISVAANRTGTEWGAAAMSDSGECYYIRLRETGGTLYGSSTRSPCTGNQALRVNAREW